MIIGRWQLVPPQDIIALGTAALQQNAIFPGVRAELYSLKCHDHSVVSC